MPQFVRRAGTGALLVALAVGWGAPACAADDVTPRIVNGVLTDGYPSVGEVVTIKNTPVNECSGTMIGCKTYLTAAHCVCPRGADTYAVCRARGITPPGDLRVFLANGGTFGVDSVEIDPSYVFEVRGDLAVLELVQSVNGVSPAPLNAVKPAPTTPGYIVGYGRTGGENNVYGIKRAGIAKVQTCRGYPEATNICFPFAEPLGPPGEDSNTCNGDSGGPLFVAGASPQLLAGVTSGGLPASCLPDPSGESFDTDVASHLEFIRAAGGSDLDNKTCGSLPQVGTAAVKVTATAGKLDVGTPTFEGSVAVAAGTAMLRVTMNGQIWDAADEPNDFDLYVKRGGPATRQDYDCRDFGTSQVAACEFASPVAATWYVLVDRFKGAGEFQVTATTFASSVCVGDCTGVGKVSVDDLVKMVNIAQGALPLSVCPAGDPNHRGTINIDDIIIAVGNALNGCPT